MNKSFFSFFLFIVLICALFFNVVQAEECPACSNRTLTPTPHNTSSAPGYCTSHGGSHAYEYIQDVTYTQNLGGTLTITVDIYIVNPTGCTYGNPCPEYDSSPEYVNAWIDWDGDGVFESGEKVMDEALTGYKNINYHGTMTTSTIVTIPENATNSTWMRVNLGWGHDPNDPCEYSWTWGDVVDKEVQNVYWLAKAIMSEASIGTREEQIAVGWTVLNRLDSGNFGSSIEDVVKSGYAYNQMPTQEIIELAKDLQERKIQDPTGSATYFFSPVSMPKEGEENKCIPPIGNGNMDCNGELHNIPGTSEKVYFPSWAKPKEGWTVTDFYPTVENLEWVSGLEGVRNWYFMFYRPIPAIPTVVITSPLTIFGYPYEVGNDIFATFSITNRGKNPITLNKLLVGGRHSDDVAGEHAGDEIVDFTEVHDITLNPGDTYNYLGTLTLKTPGIYHFFCAYYIENPTSEEKALLDENNWNTNIDVEIDGKIVDDPDLAKFHREKDIVVEKLTEPIIYAPKPKLWEEIHGPWEENLDGKDYQIKAIATDPNDAESIYIVVDLKGKEGHLWNANVVEEDIFKLSSGGWKKLKNDGLPSGGFWDPFILMYLYSSLQTKLIDEQFFEFIVDIFSL